MNWIELAFRIVFFFFFFFFFFLVSCLGMNECMNGPAGQGVLRYSFVYQGFFSIVCM